MMEYVVKRLPEEQQFTCSRCRGTGSEEFGGDAHRSPGIIPCRNHHCHGGTVKSYTSYEQEERYW